MLAHIRPGITAMKWPPLPLVLALLPLEKFPIDFKIFQWKCPLQIENDLALLKIEFQACQNVGSCYLKTLLLKNSNHADSLTIHRSIRLRPRRTCEQDHVSLSNAILHNSAVRGKHMCTHVGHYSVRLLVVQ